MLFLGPLYFEMMTSWNGAYIAARRFAPATTRVEGGGEQARPRQQGLPRGLARQSRACGAHGAARSLECSRGRRPARLESVGPASDGPAQRRSCEDTLGGLEPWAAKDWPGGGRGASGGCGATAWGAPEPGTTSPMPGEPT